MKTVNQFLNRAIRFSLAPQTHVRGIKMTVDYLAHLMRTTDDDISLLVLNRKGTQLSYLHPNHLLKMHASLPYDKEQSIEARVLQCGNPMIDNKIRFINPLLFFENRNYQSERPIRNEKALFYPIMLDGSPLGIVHISRTPSLARPNPESFEEKDLDYLKNINHALRVLFQGIRSINVVKASAA